MRKLIPIATFVLGVLVGGAATWYLLRITPSAQSGEIISRTYHEGRVNFPIPYDSPPNVSLEPIDDAIARDHIRVVKVDSRGFEWELVNPNNARVGQVRWVAQGVYANLR